MEIVNTLASQAAVGKQIFYPIYTEEMRRDPAKRDTGLFFFRGRAGAPFAICNASGGFAYVGAMQDSFSHALALSKKGYHAFARIYRPGAQTACEDLARAIAFVHKHAAELSVDAAGDALWGGSVGARMAAWLGSFGTEAFDERPYPRPAAIILQYMGGGGLRKRAADVQLRRYGGRHCLVADDAAPHRGHRTERAGRADRDIPWLAARLRPG